MLDLSCPNVQLILATIVTAVITAFTALRFYCYITLGRCHSRAKMEGKTVLITGANGGIGKETTKDIAKRGARIILACRNLDAANQVKGKDIFFVNLKAQELNYFLSHFQMKLLRKLVTRILW